MELKTEHERQLMTVGAKSADHGAVTMERPAS